jgi:hypothetical protein
MILLKALSLYLLVNVVVGDYQDDGLLELGEQERQYYQELAALRRFNEEVRREFQGIQEEALQIPGEKPMNETYLCTAFRQEGDRYIGELQI